MGGKKRIHKLWHSTNQLGPQFEPSPAPSVFQYSNMSTTLEFPVQFSQKPSPKPFIKPFSWWIFLSPNLNASLVGGFNPFEKYWSNWIISPGIGMNNKKSLSCHHPDHPSDSSSNTQAPSFTSHISDHNHPPHLGLILPEVT